MAGWGRSVLDIEIIDVIYLYIDSDNLTHQMTSISPSDVIDVIHQAEVDA
jgi:hypothetical protein